MRRRYSHHVPMADSIEPCTINCEVVAEYLAEQGRPRMADFIAAIGEQIRRLIGERDEWQERHAEALARLHHYEPPAPVSVGHRNYRAKPESDG